MRPEHVGRAISHELLSKLHDTVALHFVDRVGQRVCIERCIFANRAIGVRAVCRDAAWEDEARDAGSVAIRDRYGFHHAGGPGDVDLPHAIFVQHAGHQRVEYEGEVDDSASTSLLDEFLQLPAGSFTPEIDGLEL